MSFMVKTNCRACGFGPPKTAGGIKTATSSDKLVPVLNLGVMPLANAFKKEGESHPGYYPLAINYCPRCSLAQLSVVVDPHILYDAYSYVTSPSAMMRDHFKELLSDIVEEAPHARTVLEIGSNDGRLLETMKSHGYTVQGIDPAENLAAIARVAGVPTTSGFFGEDLARTFPAQDIVIARHVFCHVDDWGNFIRGLEALCHKETLICIEVPYVGDMLRKCELDQTYHEHLSFLSIKAMEHLLKGTALKIHRIKQYAIHGGAIVVMLRTTGTTAMLSSSVWTDNFTVEDWRVFSERAKDQIDRLRATVSTLVAQGKRVAGLGASAKSTVWINACGFTRREIAFISDNTPQKQFTFSPGTDIPIIDEGAILRELPDYLIVFCWNFFSECLTKFSSARAKGVKFIVPVPKIEVY